MDFTIFKEEFLKALKEKIETEHLDLEFECDTELTEKGISEVIKMREKEANKDTFLALPLNFIYQSYDGKMGETIDCFLKSFHIANKSVGYEDFSTGDVTDIITNTVIPVLVNPKETDLSLNDLVYKEMLDLIICYMCVKVNDDVLLTSELMNRDVFESLGMTEEELYEKAIKNFTSMFAVRFKHNSEYTALDINITSFTTNILKFGPSIMCIGILLKEMSKMFNGDFYLIPLNDFKLYAAPMSIDLDVLREANSVIRDAINILNTSPDNKFIYKILSTNIYKYNADTQSVTLACEVGGGIIDDL